MVVKVLVKRKFREQNTDEILSLLKEFRTGAMNEKGYISGVTLVKHDDPSSVVVISTWETLEDWRRWKSNQKRIKIDSMLEIYQVMPTEYEEYFLGGPAKE